MTSARRATRSRSALGVKGSPSPEPPTQAPFLQPYPPSWLNRLIDWIDRSPRPAWVYYAAGVLLLATVLTVGQWLAGGIDPEALVFSVYPVYFVALMHYLDGQARSALVRFRPALSVTDAEFARIKYELTTVPARGGWVAAALAIPLGILFILGSEPEPVSPEALPAEVIAVVTTVFTVAAFFVLAYHTVRQLRRVSQLHAAAPTINLLQPRPTYAFSRLTSRTAIGVVAFLYFDFLINPPAGGAAFTYFVLTGGALVLMAAAFFLPLFGMHQRLVTEKARLNAEVNLTLETAYQDLLQGVRSRDYAGVGDLDKTLASLLKMREVIAKLSTWPWQPETLRGLVAAVGLPVAIWLIQFGLQRLLR